MNNTILEKLRPINSGTFFCIGLAIVLLSLSFPIPSLGNTFIHSWRVELVASIFLLVTLVYGYFQLNSSGDRLRLSADEFRFLVLPMIVFIAWSAASMFWAASWRSALHHTLIWSAYLVFFVAVRNLLDRGHNYQKLVTTFCIALSFFAILAVLAYITFLLFESGPSIGIIYSKYGEQINALFPLILFGTLGLSGRKFKIGLAVLAVLWLLIFASVSRTNLILFSISIIAVTAFIFINERTRKYRARMLLVVVLLIAAPFPMHIFSLFSPDSGVLMVGRVSDTAGMTSSNNFRKLMLYISAEMFAASPIVGIGADNFGFEANKYREAFSVAQPDNPVLAESESNIPERAHNEYAQIVAELGIVGGLIFLWFLAGIGLLAFRAVKHRGKLPPHAFAAVLGLGLFLTSSLVTSYSFRLIQNGFVFFFVLAVASKLILNARKEELRADATFAYPRLQQSAFVFGAVACVLLAGFSIVRVSSSAFTIRANSTANLSNAAETYRTAMQIDHTNPTAPYFLGLRLVERGRYAEAVPYLKRSVEIGQARSTDYSYLATAQSLDGDNEGAENTFAEASRLYPRSPFVLTRYAALLMASGKNEEAKIQFERALKINAKDSNAWWAFINHGPKAANDLAFSTTDHTAVMDLRPYDSIYAIVAERDIRFPFERAKFPWQTFSNNGSY